jgi:hypothetical protein
MKLSNRAVTFGLLTAAALLMLLSACGGGSGAPAPAAAAPAVIPWVDIPSTPQSLAASASAARACVAADLDVVAGRAGAFQGQATQELTLRNRATEACSLAGVPQAQVPGAGAGGQVGAGQFAAKRVDLAPGQSATLLIGTPVGCAASAQPVIGSTVQLTLASGESIAVSGARVDTACGAPAVIGFDAVDLPEAAPGPLGSLGVSLVAPRTVSRGTVLTYRVTVANLSSASVALSPCPSYTEVLGTGAGATTQRTLLLNCRAAPWISASAARTFQMKLGVPASAPAGTTKLSWKLEVPGGPVVGAAITVS